MDRRALILALAASLGCAGSGGAPMVQDQSADARLLVMELPDTVRVEVRSPKGIGHATLRRDGAHWPPHLVIRLHLKGLEGLEFVAGSDTVRRGEPASASLPGTGWHDVEVPQDLLAGKEQLVVRWVDFYR